MNKIKYIGCMLLLLCVLGTIKCVQASGYGEGYSYEHTFNSSGWNTPSHEILTISLGSNFYFGETFIIINESGLSGSKYVNMYSYNEYEQQILTGGAKRESSNPGYRIDTDNLEYRYRVHELFINSDYICVKYKKPFTATWGSTLTGIMYPFTDILWS